MLHRTPKMTMCRMLMLSTTGMSCRGGRRSRPRLARDQCDGHRGHYIAQRHVQIGGA